MFLPHKVGFFRQGIFQTGFRKRNQILTVATAQASTRSNFLLLVIENAGTFGKTKQNSDPVVNGRLIFTRRAFPLFNQSSWATN